MATLAQVKKYILDLPPIPQVTKQFMITFINSQKSALSSPCHKSDEVNTDLIVKASESLKEAWGIDRYNELVNMILSLKPHDHKFFSREIMKFILVVSYYGLFRDHTLMAQALLLFGLFSFSYNFQTFFRICNPDLMVAAIENSHNKSLYKKYKDFAAVVSYIVADTIHTYNPEENIKKEEWLLFRMIININNRIRLSLKNLANVYHSLAKEAQNTSDNSKEYTDDYITAGVDINSILATIKSNVQQFVVDTPDVYAGLAKKLKIQPEILMHLYNYWIEQKFRTLFELMAVLLSHAVKQIEVSNEAELCTKIYKLKEAIEYLLVTKTVDLRYYRNMSIKFIDDSLKELGYESLTRKLLMRDKAKIFSNFIGMLVNGTVCHIDTRRYLAA